METIPMINIILIASQIAFEQNISFNSSPLVPRVYALVNRVRICSDNSLSPIRRQAIISTKSWVTNWTHRNKLQRDFSKKNTIENVVCGMAVIMSEGGGGGGGCGWS